MAFSALRSIFQGNPVPNASANPTATPSSERTAAAVQPVFQTPPPASLGERLIASVMGKDTEARIGFQDALSRLSLGAQGDVQGAKQVAEGSADPAPALPALPPVQKILPSIYIPEDDLEGDHPAQSPPAAAPAIAQPAAATSSSSTSTLPIVAAAKVDRPSFMGANREAWAAQTKETQARLFGPTPSLASQALSLFKGRGQTERDLLEGVMDAFKERKKLILQAARKLNEKHPEFNLKQIYALYEEAIVSSPSVREQAEKIYQNYSTIMERVKTMAQRMGVDPQSYAQAAHKALLEKFAGQDEREELETTLIAVKAQHYFASYDPESSGSVCLENFADNFEKDVEEALKYRLGSTFVPEHHSELKRRIENDFLKGAAMVKGALESVAVYRSALPGSLLAGSLLDNALIEKRKGIVRRLREIVIQSPDSIRNHSESLKYLDSLPPQEREAYLKRVGVRDSTAELKSQLQRFQN